MNLKKEFKFHLQWPHVRQVLDTLSGAGYQAFIVGGAVRDALMKLPIKDFDISTDALPEQVEALFPKTIDIGKKFGVIAVVLGEGVAVEVTTFRKESEYNSKRQPTKVEFTDLQGDASRRDFTINALYYDLYEDRLIDPFQGESDIRSQCLRAIGDAQERLTEDPLRILRAIRFHGRLHFEMDEELKKALSHTRTLISGVAKERVFEELNKAFQFHCWKRSLKALSEFDLWQPLELPTPSEDRLKRLSHLTVDGGFLEVFAWLWWDQPLESAKKFLGQLKVPGKLKEALCFLIFEGSRLIDEEIRKGEMFLIFSKAPFGFIQFLKGLCELRLCDEKFQKIQGDLLNYKKILNEKGKLPEPLVKGEELIDRGIKKGPLLGAFKNELYLRQLEGSFTSLKQLEKLLKEFLRTSNEV